MKKKSIHIGLLFLITISIVASPPPPPGFGGAGEPMGFGEPSGPPGFESVPAPQEAPYVAPHREPQAESVVRPEEHRTPSAFDERHPSDLPREFGEHREPEEFGSSRRLPMGMPEGRIEPSGPGFSPLTESMESEEPASSSSSMQEPDDVTNYDQHVSSLPMSVQHDDETIAQEDVTVQEGINNFDVEGSGNWLLKRVWWEKTEEVYEKIKVIFNQVLETRSQFITARNKLDRELDIFYGEMGLEQGPLNDIITHTLDLMEKLRKSQGDVLTKKEEALVKKTQEKEPVLAQLKADVKAIQAVEDKLDQALNTLFKQIDVCNEYEQRAWNNFKDIARELNDKEARKSYYQTQALLEDIEKIQAYLTGAFSTYFDQTVQLARDHAQKITANMQNLRNQGIDLQKEAQLLENDRDEPQGKHDVQKNKEEEAKKKAQLGFFGRIKQFFSDVFAKIASWFGSTEAKVKTRGKKAEKIVEQHMDELDKEASVSASSLSKAFDGLKKTTVGQVKKETHAVSEKAHQIGKDIVDDYSAGLFGAQPSVAKPGYAHETATQAVDSGSVYDLSDPFE